MKYTSFWIQLVILTSMCFAGLFLIGSLDWADPHLNLYSGLISVMFVYTVVFFYLGKRTVKSENPYLFIRLVIAGIMIKLFVVVGLVATYFKLVEPDSKYFVLPYIVVYLIFSIFETYALYKVALEKKSIPDE